jgi:hypothetical protein
VTTGAGALQAEGIEDSLSALIERRSKKAITR